VKALGGNYIFVDSQNVNLGIQALGWRLDFQKFRVYLAEKYGVEKAYLFLGYVAKYAGLYEKLQSFGYDLVFKEVVRGPDGAWKGNCDSELVLQAMIDFENYQHAGLVSGDGDFTCPARYLVQQNQLLKVLVPNHRSYSRLLLSAAQGRLAFLSDSEQFLAIKQEHR
jgi:uncharacterized LabA/DUF88 family protein